MLPTGEGLSEPSGKVVKWVDDTWSNLLLYDPNVGVQSGFYDPNDQTLYRHNEEYDLDDECYDWVYEACPGATHFMVITLPEDAGASANGQSIRPIPSWLLGAGGLAN
ncbi:hypothetical protein [uncultured Fibrella sp.]|uniref:hypothetical protein n=1 Tax=uncultured Fibrella sp. TaxID=1284596 RepID=UPI0035CC5229